MPLNIFVISANYLFSLTDGILNKAPSTTVLMETVPIGFASKPKPGEIRKADSGGGGLFIF